MSLAENLLQLLRRVGLHEERPRSSRGHRAPLGVMKLERRRVLSADFSLTPGALLLDGFDNPGGDSLTVTESDSAYEFTLAAGEWNDAGPLGDGVSVSGATLSVDKAVVDGLADGLQISSVPSQPLSVEFGEVNFAGMNGQFVLSGATSLGSIQGATLESSDTDFMVVSSPAGLTLSDFSFAGDIELLAIGPIVDAPGADIFIDGNATFNSVAVVSTADFNDDGYVDTADFDIWLDNFGSTGPAGDANTDGMVDSIDYAIWRTDLGTATPAGILLGDTPGDTLTVTGRATFQAKTADGSQAYNIKVGEFGQANFETLSAFGDQVAVWEDSIDIRASVGTNLDDVTANEFYLQSDDEVTDVTHAQILVADWAEIKAEGNIVLADTQGVTTNSIIVGGHAKFEVDANFQFPSRIDVGVISSGAMEGQHADGHAQFGTLQFIASNGAVRITEDFGLDTSADPSINPIVNASGTHLAYASVADSLQLASADDITDQSGVAGPESDVASVFVLNDATFTTFAVDSPVPGASTPGGDIVLADDTTPSTGNFLEVQGHAKFETAEDFLIDVGVDSTGAMAAAEANFRTLQFVAPTTPAATGNQGRVRIAEDSGTWLSNASLAKNLDLYSAGAITDASEADTEVVASIMVLRDATLTAETSIQIADDNAPGTANAFTTGLHALFSIATPGSSPGSIFVGVTPEAGPDLEQSNALTPVEAQVNLGTLQFSTTGDARIAEDSGTLLSLTSVANTLKLSSAGKLADDATADVEVTDFATFATFSPTGENIELADAGASNRLIVGGHALFTVEQGAGNKIFAGAVVETGADLMQDADLAAAGAEARFGTLQFLAEDGDVRLAEDFLAVETAASRGLMLSQASTANTLKLASAGRLQDDNSAAVTVTDFATFSTLSPSGEFIELADDDTTATVNSLSVGGHTRFEVVDGERVFVGVAMESGGDLQQDIDLAPVLANAQFGTLQFVANGGDVRIAEDDGTLLSQMSIADTLKLSSAGKLADDSTADLQAGAFATFATFGVAGENIELADAGVGNRLVVDGHARFQVAQGAAIGNQVFVGVNVETGAALMQATNLSPADAEARFGTLQFLAEDGDTRIAEDDGTLLAMESRANTLKIASAGKLADDTAADVETGDFATFSTFGPAGENIELADDAAGNRLVVGGHALFEVAQGAATPNKVFIGTAIESGADLLQGVDLTPTAAEATFGSLQFQAQDGAVRIAEDNSTMLALTSLADTLKLASAGKLADSDTADVEIDGFATFSTITPTGENIELANGAAGNRLVVGGHALFEVQQGAATGNRVFVGATVESGISLLQDSDLAAADAEVRFGTLQFLAQDGDARIAEDLLPGEAAEGMLIAQQNLASTAKLASAGILADSSEAVILITDFATFTTFDTPTANGGNIELADHNDLATTNSLIVHGHAKFEVAQVEDIPGGVPSNNVFIGIVLDGAPPESTPLTPADANAQLGTLQVLAGDGVARIALDGPIVAMTPTANFSGNSEAEDLGVHATGGDIADNGGSNVNVGKRADMRAAGNNIVLGDGAGAARSYFRVMTPNLFDPSNYLSMRAENVSVHADSPLNLRTSAEDSSFSGSFFLSAAESISQVGDGVEIKPLTADRVALASDAGALLFSSIQVMREVTDSSDPNLSLYAGGTESYSGLIESRSGEFPTDEIEGGADDKFVPTGYNRNLASQTRADQSGLDDVPGAVVDDPGALGDAYSLIAVVRGDAKIGIVEDATGAQAARTGVNVSSMLGNAFLRTLAIDQAMGEVGEQDSAGAITSPEAGDIVFSSQGAGDDTVVQIMSGVFTAIAAGQLTIDTKTPDQDAGARTTILRSATGAVSSVAEYESPLGVGEMDVMTYIGPRFILDLPSEEEDAATTGLVRAVNADGTVLFEQRVTFAVGSRGEDNLVIEFEWADVAMRRTARIDPDFGDAAADPLMDPRPETLPADIDGTIPIAEVTLAPVSIESQGAQSVTPAPGRTLLVQTSDPNLEFRVVTARHEFSTEFIPDNPTRPRLPTTIRVYNDPSINLYDLGGERDLNAAVNFVNPRVVAVTGGYVPPSEPVEPTVFPLPEPAPVEIPVVIAEAQTAQFEEGATAETGAETVKYGRVYASKQEILAEQQYFNSQLEELKSEGQQDSPEYKKAETLLKKAESKKEGDFVDDILTGEKWPKEYKGEAEGDFIEDIRQEIEQGPAPEGRYKIISKTSRSEQQLEAWQKTDAQLESSEQDLPEVTAEPTGPGPVVIPAQPADPPPLGGPIDPAEMRQNQVWDVSMEVPTDSLAGDPHTHQALGIAALTVGGAASRLGGWRRASDNDHRKSSRLRQRIKRAVSALDSADSKRKQSTSEPER